MAPRVRAVRLPVAWLLLALLAIAFPAPAPSEFSWLAGLSDLSPGARPAAAEDKQRVPRSEPRYKPSSDRAPKEEGDDDESNGFLESCFGSCLEGLFDSMFSHGKNKEDLAAPPRLPASSAALASAPDSTSTERDSTRFWASGDRGWLVADAPGDSVVLWQGEPAGADADLEAGRLPDGAAVVVLEARPFGGAVEVRVRAAEGDTLVGWIPEERITAAGPAPADSGRVALATPPPPAPHAPWTPKYVNAPPRLEVRLVPGIGIFYNHDPSVEYGRSTLALPNLDLQVTGFARSGFLAGVGAGWRAGIGTPKVVYVASDVLDEPRDSRWRELRFDLHAGMRWGDGKLAAWGFALGPALFRARERATLRSWAYDTTSGQGGAFLGEREELLSRWTLGGILRIFGEYQVSPSFTLGVQVDSHLIAWKGRREKSLTSDFERNPIGVFDVGIALAYRR